MRRLLVANRGEIARRITRTCRRLGIETVGVYSSADRDAAHVAEADLAVELAGPPEKAYLDIEAIVDAIHRTSADAVHPGYGFLAESASFAAAVETAGAVFVGPPTDVIAAMGDKIEAVARARAAGVPVLAGTQVGPEGAIDGTQISLPVLVKAAAGGGGRGMRLVGDPAELTEAIGAASREAAAAFGDGRVYLERHVAGARHVEVQVVGDAHGGVIHLYERDCSVQRRHQKIIEESPAPELDEELRAALWDAGVRLARSIGYVGAGTVEFLVAPTGEHFFLEMNTRLQVEHPVTEAITGLDLVELQLLVADGGALPSQNEVPPPNGHAIEARVVAEDPRAGNLPQVGRILRWEVPEPSGVRVDAGVVTGDSVSPFYDSLLGKVIAQAPQRAAAIGLLAATLAGSRIHGITTNRDLLVAVLRHPRFRSADVDTGFLDRHRDDVRGPSLPPPLERAAVVAAAIAQATAARASAAVMTSVPSGWRNVDAVPQTRVYEIGGEPVEVRYRIRPAGGTAAEIDGEPLEIVVHGFSGETVDLSVGGVRRRFTVAVYGDRVEVDGPGGGISLVARPRLPRQEPRAAVGSLTAPLPGTVVAVHVEPGAVVRQGDPLVVVEAMKMEHTVSAPHDGSVTTIAVVGDRVLAGDVVAGIRPHADS